MDNNVKSEYTYAKADFNIYNIADVNAGINTSIDTRDIGITDKEINNNKNNLNV